MSVQLNLSTNGVELKAAYREVVDRDCTTNWILLGYTKGSNELKVDEKGDGGLEELSEEFVDDKVLFAFARVTDPNSQLPKFVLISWCGEAAPVQRKGLLPSHLGHVQKFLDGYHVQINARDADDVTPEQIMKKVTESSGAKYSYHDQVRKQAPAIAAGARHLNSRAQPSVTGYRSSTEASPPVLTANASHASSLKPPVSNAPKTHSQQPLDRADKERQIREEQERFEKEFLKKSHSRSQSAGRVGGVAFRVQEAREREERELQERLEKARISRENSIVRKHSQPRGTEQLRENAALENTKRQEEERRREAEVQAQQQAEANLREQNQRLADEAARLQEEEERLRSEREAEARERQKAKELEAQERERARIQKEQEELEIRRLEQLELEDQQRKQAEYETQQIEQAEFEARESEQQELQMNTEAQKEQVLSNSAAEETLTEVVPQSTAIALFAYTAADETEIGLREGELIVAIQQVDEGWWQGTNEAGDFGLFPANYVELVAPPEPAAPQTPLAAETSINEGPTSQAYAIALYDYEASEEGEISFRAADRITNIDFLSEDWWQGTNPAGQSGLFPANYVELQQ